mmetsp:Transcript_103255/g.301191  ORF Transcript_103255/g.301191 Transcript_103255/m.301191 type:complete len:352 (+) Transcript_103255:835-1890(+)
MMSHCFAWQQCVGCNFGICLAKCLPKLRHSFFVAFHDFLHPLAQGCDVTFNLTAVMCPCLCQLGLHGLQHRFIDGLKTLKQGGYTLHLTICFDAEAGKSRGQILDLLRDALLKRRHAALGRLNRFLHSGTLLRGVLLRGGVHGHHLQTLTDLQLQISHSGVQVPILLLHLPQARLQVVLLLRAALERAQVLLELPEALHRVLQGVINPQELCDLPLLRLLRRHRLEPAVLLQRLHLLLQVPVSLFLGLRAARPRPKALVEALDTPGQGLRLVYEALDAALDLCPLLAAVVLAHAFTRALFELRLQLALQLRKASPVCVMLALKAGNHGCDLLCHGRQVAIHSCARHASGLP